MKDSARFKEEQHRDTQVEYHILLSPTYRVPVLHILLDVWPSNTQPSLDAVYTHLVPHQYRLGVSNQGALGSISAGVRLFEAYSSQEPSLSRSL